jgi:hypothetical protein
MLCSCTTRHMGVAGESCAVYMYSMETILCSVYVCRAMRESHSFLPSVPLNVRQHFLPLSTSQPPWLWGWEASSSSCVPCCVCVLLCRLSSPRNQYSYSRSSCMHSPRQKETHDTTGHAWRVACTSFVCAP